MIDCKPLSSDYLEKLRMNAKEKLIPLNATFELTPFCNFSCVMCYVKLTDQQAEKQGKIMSAQKWIDLARQAREMGTLYVTLTGGEPFLHPEFWEIYSELNKMGFLISILSNGSLIDESVIRKFREYGMPFTVKLTLYGASDETYKKVCNSTDGFTKISKAVDLLKSENVPVKLTSTVVRENADDLQAMYSFANTKGVSLQHTISVLKSSRGATNSVDKSRFMFSDFPDELTLEELENNMIPRSDSPFAWCASYGTSFWMTWHGRLQMCSFMNNPETVYSGNLFADYFGLYQKLRLLKNPAECEKCEWQEFCQRCPGALCAESGNPEKINADLCDVARRLYELYRTRKGEMI